MEGWAQRAAGASAIGRGTIIAVDMGPRLRALALGEDPAEHELELDQRRLKIRLSRTAEQHASANLLIRKMYAWRGYQATDAAHAPNRVSLSVFAGERITGTMTLGLDGEEGLAADTLYHAELEALRAEGRRLCEITRLAVDPSVASRRLLFSLFHIAYIYARRLNGCTDAIIEVNPCHERFYRRALGFRRLGEEKLCPRVHAPAVLLRLEFDYADAQLAQFAGHPEWAATEKSLYPYAFSPAEEAGIAQRLLRACV